MTRTGEDPVREHRIAMEIIADAYNAEGRAMGWYYYPDDKLHVLFKARCVGERHPSPLAKQEEVRVEGLTAEEECLHEMFIDISWSGRMLAVLLSQLRGEALLANPVSPGWRRRS